MTDSMDNLVQFLRARLDNEAAGAISWHDLECDIHAHLDAGLLAQIAASRMLEEVPGAVCDCGGPARVLREVEAKRQIVDACAPPLVEVTDLHSVEREFIPGEGAPWGLPVLRLLALPYADHPDYQETWKP